MQQNKTRDAYHCDWDGSVAGQNKELQRRRPGTRDVHEVTACIDLRDLDRSVLLADGDRVLFGRVTVRHTDVPLLRRAFPAHAHEKQV